MDTEVPFSLIESPERPVDRLSALLRALAPEARSCAPGDPAAVLVVTADAVVLRLDGGPLEPGGLAAAAFGFALPVEGLAPRVEIRRAACPALAALAEVFVAEARGGRCGAPVAAARLAEAIAALALRRAVELGAASEGVLAALAHPRLHRAVVAIHDDPTRPWTVAALAEIAGMSRSRFMDRFRAALGVGPRAYLARWRLRLAARDLAAGRPLKEVARRAGYGSTAAFGRAYRRLTEARSGAA